MLPADSVAELALRLYRARKDGSQVPQFSREFAGLSIEDAYAIQREWVRLERADGKLIRGYKVGLTSRALQLALQATEPNFAPLMDDMFFESGSDIRAARFIAPRVEVELAFVLERSLQGPGITVADVLRATAYVTPALELIDARIEQFDRETRQPRKLVDVICDFGAAAGVVLGGARANADTLDLRWTGAMLYKNELIEETGLGAAVLGHPALSIAWLANKMAAGERGLEAGDILLAGSFTKPVAAARDDVLRADYGALGGLSFKLT
jgi:2-oxo-hept-3-ene-1,7-dioate hydratase